MDGIKIMGLVWRVVKNALENLSKLSTSERNHKEKFSPFNFISSLSFIKYLQCLQEILTFERELSFHFVMCNFKKNSRWCNFLRKNGLIEFLSKVKIIKTKKN
jgi:hypothetical protein